MQQIFENSGFTRTLCGSTWDSLTGDNNAFNNLGSSTARYGCCPDNTYMSKPFLNEDTFNADSSCSECPVGKVAPSVLNDETSCSCSAGSFSSPGSTSCQLCASGKSSAVGSSSCDLTTIKLPNGNGKKEAADRVGDTLGRIVDDILGTDSSKKELATKTYGPIENWDVSAVTDISFLFFNKKTMNADLSSWDVSGVTTMADST